MKTTLIWRAWALGGALVLSACGAGGPATGTTQPPPPAAAESAAVASGVGWTGVTHPAELIEARMELMVHMEERMKPLDLLDVQPVKDPQAIRAAAESVAVMLHAVPHLFPPTTNLYDPASTEPATIALPAIWEQFDNFHALARASITAAEAVAATTDARQLPAASRALRGSCDACHAVYLRKYEPPKVSEADRGFDFDAAIGAP